MPYLAVPRSDRRGPFQGPTCMRLGQLGNAVPPPLGYAVAAAVEAALEG